jgi:hypothetical protein
MGEVPSASDSFATLAEPELVALAKRVDDEWGSDAAHRALLALCVDLGRQAQVAAWYRKQAAHPDRVEVAEAQLKRLTALAMLQLDAQRAQREPQKPKKTVSYVLFLVFVVGAVVLLTLL